MTILIGVFILAGIFLGCAFSIVGAIFLFQQEIYFASAFLGLLGIGIGILIYRIWYVMFTSKY